MELHAVKISSPWSTATAYSTLAFSDDVIVINSFSKYYCMTGWRIGWMVVPSNITRTVECLAQNIALSVNVLSQVAGVVAFDSTEELEAVKAGYAVNRDIGLLPVSWTAS